jgi:multidrug resistance efflux pump
MKNLSWKPAAAAALTVFMLISVVRAVTAQPSTSPNADDIRLAARTVSPPPGRRDLRDTLPEGDLVSGNGVVEPADREVRVAPSVAGRVARVFAREGTRVQAGDPLVELEQSAERAALAAAEADVAVVAAELTRTRRGTRSEDLDAAEADAAAARARATLSYEVFARTTRLAQGGDATTDELDRARRQAETDQAQLRQSEARRRAAVNGSRREDIAVAVARLRAAEARRDQAREQLARLTVRAPAEADVLFVKCRAGEYASPAGDPLVILGDTRVLRARVDVDEREIAQIRLGANAFITVEAFPGRRVPGRVVDIARRFGRRNVRSDDPSERIDAKVLEVVVQLSEPNGLLPGQRIIGYLLTTRGGS